MSVLIVKEIHCSELMDLRLYNTDYASPLLLVHLQLLAGRLHHRLPFIDPLESCI